MSFSRIITLTSVMTDQRKKTQIATMHKTRELSESLPDLFDLEVAAIAEQIKRIEVEAEKGVIEERLTPDDDIVATVAQDMLVILNAQ